MVAREESETANHEKAREKSETATENKMLVFEYWNSVVCHGFHVPKATRFETGVASMSYAVNSTVHTRLITFVAAGICRLLTHASGRECPLVFVHNFRNVFH
ncbi:hypothetical protein PC114_g21129 [Phytophthora cactorum]|nr:hypothetical protein PC114_g21129 [Phytophthora cactorum]KAG3019754.1 hypothetical protein PC120_g9697 [Phytophthora cactorum]KAG3136426.1 hypothetical protein C6341_g21393 [Phytophthora cactorum]